VDPPIRDLPRALQSIARAHPERLFACFEGEPIHFAQLAAAAAAVAARLHAQGLHAGDRVVVVMANSPLALAVVHGLLRAGLVWVPVNPLLVGEPLAHVLRTVAPGLILCDAGLETGLQAVLAQLDGGDVPVEAICDHGLPQGASDFTDALGKSSDLNKSNGINGALPAPDDLAAIMFTSGTTGPAKGVMVTHTMLALAAEAVALCADLQPGDNLFVWEPFHHIGGAQVILLPLVRDVRLSIVARFSASRFWRQVAESGCTHIHHLGGIIQILLKQAPGPQDRAHRVRIAWGGGCASEVWRAFEERFGVQIRECYGMTECSSLTTWNAEGALGSVGRPAPWFDVTIQDGQGRVLDAGAGAGGGAGACEQRGEIVVRTRLPGAITPGYYRNRQASQRAIRADGFHTGDLGSWDAEGRLIFHGRMSDSVRCKGENVSAFEVESVALRHPQVRDAAMVGVPTDVGEYDIQLFIQPQPDNPPDPAELWHWMAPQLAPYQRPRYIALVADFPRTASQRIQKHRLVIDPAARWQAR